MSKEEITLKSLRIKFIEMHESDEQIIRKYINTQVMSKQHPLDADGGGHTPKAQREDVRLIINDLAIEVHTHETDKLPEQTFKGLVTDLSAGGMCLSIDPDIYISKNSVADLHLDFIKEKFTVKGIILGLQYQD